jgi:hypothetical protein
MKTTILTFIVAVVLIVVTLCLLTRLLLIIRCAVRVGAFSKAKERGMTDEEARAYVLARHRMTKEDYAYEAIQREKADRRLMRRADHAGRPGPRHIWWPFVGQMWRASHTWYGRKLSQQEYIERSIRGR